MKFRAAFLSDYLSFRHLNGPVQDRLVIWDTINETWLWCSEAASQNRTMHVSLLPESSSSLEAWFYFLPNFRCSDRCERIVIGIIETKSTRVRDPISFTQFTSMSDWKKARWYIYSVSIPKLV